VRTVGFIGLGTMGGPMCRHVVAKSGARVLAFDIDAEALRRCTDAGAIAARGVAELAAVADVIMTSLPMPSDVERVALGAGGIAEHTAPGTVYVDLSTSSPTLTRRIGAALDAKGVTMLDAPVSGLSTRAEAGTLAVMVGGDWTAFDAHRDLLETFGANVMHVGALGTATVAKLVNNLLGNCYMAAAAEGLMLGAASGLDPARLDAAIQASSGNSLGYRVLADRAFTRDFTPQFALDLAYKDTHLALELANELGVPVPLTAQVHNLMRMARGLGLGALDCSAVIKVYETTQGRELGVPGDRPASGNGKAAQGGAARTTVGFIGLGAMGGPICRNIAARSGARVVAYDPDLVALGGCLVAGAETTPGVEDLVAMSDIVLTSLPTPADVEQVALGPGGIAESASPGTVYVDLTTNAPSVARRVAAELERQGITMLDAPVTGGPAGAEAGTLALMAGGDPRMLDRLRWLFETFTAQVIHVGSIGSGCTAKLTTQLLSLCNAAAAAEAFMLGVAAGIEPRTLDEVVRNSSGDSIAFRALSDNVLSGDFTARFALDLADKDIRLGQQMADELGVPTPLGAALQTVLRLARGMGLGRLDATAMAHFYETVLQRPLLSRAEL
jgi:3-hydroxyisobutyrate dehydrogenase-like beta-hydroxyacid dehydrogenase